MICEALPAICKMGGGGGGAERYRKWFSGLLEFHENQAAIVYALCFSCDVTMSRNPTLCQVLGIPVTDVQQALTHRTIEAQSDVVTTTLGVEQSKTLSSKLRQTYLE